jgi:TonB family protein
MRHYEFRLALLLVFILSLLSLSRTARCQSREPVWTQLDETYLNSLASHAAQKIRAANLQDKEPRVLVIDFFRSAPGNSSRLGTFLADRFSESLTAYAAGVHILDRSILKDYLTKNWTTLKDLESRDVCLQIGRQLGATGVILGTLYEENGQISLTIHLEGFGPADKEAELFWETDERTRFLLTQELHSVLFEPGPSYARKADEIPEEPGILKIGSGVGGPRCISCPSPSYSDAGLAAHFSGAVMLSIVVTTDGRATSIYVTKGAPFGLTAKAIAAVQDWSFEPALKDHHPVPARVDVEISFHIDVNRHDED